MAQPALRRAFDKVERSVGKPLEDAVASQRYVDLVVKGMKAQLAVNRVVKRTIDHQIARALHLLNIPAYSDLRRLSRQMATLTGEVRGLTEQADKLSVKAERLEDQRAELPHDPPIDRGRR